MGQQLYRRLPHAFVVEILEAFNEHRIAEAHACELLGLQRTRLYDLRRAWLRHREAWELAAPARTARGWPVAIQAWLHAECQYVRDQVGPFQGRFNFAMLAEAAHQRFGRRLSRSGVRRWAIRQGYYQQTRAEVQKVYVRWESAGPGALWHHDASHHCWLPRQGGYHDLILTEDDYSRRIVGWHLAAQETLWAHLGVVETAIGQWGRPRAYYVDSHGFFRYVTHKSAWRRYRATPADGVVQFRRVLQALDVGVIYAKTPQAKGKIEKRFDYFQRRLPVLCDRYRIPEVRQAGSILDDLVGYYNEQRCHHETEEIPARRWAQGLQVGRGQVRPVPADVDLALVCALQHPRVVHSDGRVRFLGRGWPVSAPPGSRVTVCWRPEERLAVLWNDHRVGDYPL